MEELTLKAETKEENFENTKEKVYQPQLHGRDANSHLIFSNPVLTCQFLKGYTGIPLFQELTPEDIEDVTERYKAFLGVEFESDTVKRVRIHQDGEEREVYVVSLIEHKSYVDYDIAMQLLRYMVVIWHDYKMKRNKEKRGSSSLKNFKYPLIIPVVYYEGAENWTADLNLFSRIEFGDMMREYLPDFKYKVVRLHDYTNDELQEKNDEMSLVMMINKVQSAQDYQKFLDITKKFIVTIYQNTSAEIQEVYREVIWTLLMKMKVPEEQAQEMMDGLGVKGMGYLFENLKGIDIGKMQEESRKLKENIENMKEELTDAQSQLTDTQSQLTDAKSQLTDAKSQLTDAKSQLTDTQSQLTDAKSQLTDTQSQLTDTRSELELTRKKLLHLVDRHAERMYSRQVSEREALEQLMELFDLSKNEALEIIHRYWK